MQRPSDSGGLAARVFEERQRREWHSRVHGVTNVFRRCLLSVAKGYFETSCALFLRREFGEVLRIRNSHVPTPRVWLDAAVHGEISVRSLRLGAREWSSSAGGRTNAGTVTRGRSGRKQCGQMLPWRLSTCGDHVPYRSILESCSISGATSAQTTQNEQ